jgi:hypothetical protein
VTLCWGLCDGMERSSGGGMQRTEAITAIIRELRF